MPKVNVEILRTVTITREENVVVELVVPKRVLDDEDVISWVDEQVEAQNATVTELLDKAEWDVADEDESIEYNEATALD